MAKRDENDEVGTQTTWEAAFEESSAARGNWLKLEPGETPVELTGPPRRRWNGNYERHEYVYEVRSGGQEMTLSAATGSALATQLNAAGKAGLTRIIVVRSGIGQKDTRYTVLDAATRKPVPTERPKA